MQVISKIRILSISGLILILCFLMSCQVKNNSKTRILLITGGHHFDTSEFFDLFADLSNYSIDTLSQPYANSLIGSGKADVYDVLVFYDSWQTISEAEKKGYLDLTERGTGLLFLHHSLVSYQEWDVFTNIRGGRYPNQTLRTACATDVTDMTSTFLLQLWIQQTRLQAVLLILRFMMKDTVILLLIKE